MKVKYLPDNLETIEKLLPWQKKNLSFTATGYGSEIPTSKMRKYNGKFYRVYCTIFSNIGSCWIQTKKEKLYLR